MTGPGRARTFLATLALSASFAAVLPGPTRADTGDDPLRSPVWTLMVEKYLGGAPVVHDARVVVTVPMVVENQAQVPVTVDARAIAGVTKLVVIADLNPIERALVLTPKAAAPYVSMRLKVEQATPVRAAALGADGVWHVGSVQLDAMGGGCTAPAAARKDGAWTETVGQTQGRLWRGEDGLARLRFKVRHPMDTGLAKDNTPAYFIEAVAITAASGQALAQLELFEPVAEDPTMTLLLRLPAGDASVAIAGRDNNGGLFRANVQALAVADPSRDPVR